MVTRNEFIPFSLPTIGEEEINEVVDTLRSGWLSIGPKTEQFEKQFAAYIGVPYAVGLNSCTAALHLALLAHGIGKGDEVILPSFTFAATANMVVAVGATPIFADIERETYTLDPEDVEKRITPKTKAIIPVHYGGHPARMFQLLTLAKQYSLIVIEDAAHAIGSQYQGNMIGNLGNTTCFSFYATKNLCTGEGGMLTTTDKAIYDFVMKNRLHGISKDAWKRYQKGGSWQYELQYAGWKYNMTDLDAALGIPQLKKLDHFNAKRAQLVRRYHEGLHNLSHVRLSHAQPDIVHANHLFTIEVSENRNSFMEALTQKNIGTSVHFIPLHTMPFYQKTYGYKWRDLPVTETVFSHIVSLPLYPTLSVDDVDYIISAIKEVLSQ